MALILEEVDGCSRSFLRTAQRTLDLVFEPGRAVSRSGPPKAYEPSALWTTLL